MSTDTSIRTATSEDATAMLAIYAPFVRDTTVSFEATVPSLSEFRERVTKYSASHAWLVAMHAGVLVGYAYGSPHRERPAYRWSTETSVYVAPAAQRLGIGRALYQSLMPLLADRGFCNAYAGVALPNDASVAMHRAAGFVPIGVFPRVGHKFDQWCDVSWLHLPLRAEPPAHLSA